MLPEPINLLPAARLRGLARDYLLRLSVVAILTASTLVVLHGVLLVPTYVFVSHDIGTKQARLLALESTLASSGEADIEARLQALSADADLLSKLEANRSSTLTLGSVLELPRPGIALSNIVFTVPSDTTPGIIVLSGTAGTRDALRRFQIALQSSALVTSADLPVSAFAKDTDIDFTIDVTLAP